MQLLRRTDAELTPGLTFEEISTVEDRFGFRFHPEHGEFLRVHLPVGQGWPDWRSGDAASLEERLAWPVEGVLSHVHGIDGFWPRTWGPRPDNQTEALGVARRRLESAPRLIPVFSHRYLPAAPAPSPAPVFSVYQTDVIYYGSDLGDYVAHEFRLVDEVSAGSPRVRIPFWSDLAEGAEDVDL